MRVPVATYRIQLSPKFNFEQLKDILDYLEAMGIDTIYAAPFFQATEGSLHGYDVVDPLVINSGIGTLDEFKAIRSDMDKRGMGWLQDIVPNHMAFDGTHPWLRDICELGPKSRYYNFFDINWDYKDWDQVMAPYLGGTLEEVLDKGDLKLSFDKDGLHFNYYDQSYPASMQTYSGIFAKAGTVAYNQDLADIENDTGFWQHLKHRICTEIYENEPLLSELKSVVETINNSPKRLTAELELQFFKPAHWKLTEEEINYRRFFTVNDLICLRMEDPQVFATYHEFITNLCHQGLITGLRIDHIDGLFDPEDYFKKLHKLVGEDFYIVAEKILEKDEKLPNHWPIGGTSGYEFLASVNQVLTDESNESPFTEEYSKMAPHLLDYDSLIYQMKLFMFQKRMGGELHNLVNLLHEHDLMPGGLSLDDSIIKEALSAFLAAFPLYRIYPQKFPLNDQDVAVIDTAYDKACEKAPQSREMLDYLKSLLTGTAEKDAPDMLYFLQRCQQFTGPLAAKGGEDTSFYIYNRLVSHNEVGDSPDNFGISVADFHENMQYRKTHLSYGLSATATHDTKRGEDARMRLNVLSEIPEEWFGLVEKWNASALSPPDGGETIRTKSTVPTANETYFIYQMLLGSLPTAKTADKTFLERTKAYLQKAEREAKVNTNWADPDLDHEQGVFDFVKNLLAHDGFQESFEPFFNKIKRLGAIKSLSQSLIKITAPGIPDTYQGTELWDLSYVDPDNRRPVDYELRKKYLDGFKKFPKENSGKELKDLRTNFHDGRIKMYVQYRALQLRKSAGALFLNGEYLPLEITGKAAAHFMAFARVHENKWSITVVSVLVSEYFKSEELLPDLDLLEESQLILPENAPTNLTNHLTLEHVAFASSPPAGGQALKAINLKQLLAQFPVALLSNIH